MSEVKEKIYKCSLVMKPETSGQLEFNELKLTSLISEIEREILAIRMKKVSHILIQEKNKEEMTNKSKNPSGFIASLSDNISYLFGRHEGE